jgi:hypothetical protein
MDPMSFRRMAAGALGLLIAAAAFFEGDSRPLLAQGTAMPPGGSPGGAGEPASGGAATPPSLAAQGGGQAAPRSRDGQLPREAGQEYREYDLRPYTGYLTHVDQPQQAVVDWILRETGTDVWFGEPFGFLSADRSSLLVYHTPEMHAVVGEVVDRFVAGTTDPQVVSLRVMTVGSPNWRARATPLMQHVSVQSPGVQAWLVTKENAAIVMSMLRQRGDAREVQSLDLVMHNGQTEPLASTRGRNYVRNIRPALTGWPPYEPEIGEVQEGYRLEFSPLVARDGATIDCVIRAEIDQLEKLVPVDLNLPLPSGQSHRARIEVPQMVSWRLHERFRWPTDRVLVLSCGVIASPDRGPSAIPLLDLSSITGTTAGRADAVMFIEFRGRATENVLVPPRVASPGPSFSRGRY